MQDEAIVKMAERLDSVEKISKCSDRRLSELEKTINELRNALKVDIKKQDHLDEDVQKLHEENKKLQESHVATVDQLQKVQETLSLNTTEYQAIQDGRIDSVEKYQTDQREAEHTASTSFQETQEAIKSKLAESQK